MSRILILSDLHLCKRISNIESVSELRPLWQGFDELILNGDTEETYSLRYGKNSKVATRTLIKTAEDDGLRVRLLNGNHDPMISESNHYSSHDNRVLVMHGHVVLLEVTPWTWYGKKIALHRQELIKESDDSFESQLLTTQLASDRSASSRGKKNRPPLIALPYRIVWGILRILQVWKAFPKLTANWISRYAPKTKIVVVGHTHRAGIWKVQDLVIINTGCFGFPSHPRAAIIENNTLRVFRVRKKENAYYLDQELGSWQLDAL
ncbi:metallophosphoesterase family protein [PVC group bacterium]|nr:metallophosphoesterase family protein [PVC group bacterium]